jgi:hypothetical protein
MRARDVPQRHGGSAVVVAEGDEEPRIVRRLCLAELVARGATLFAQADELGRWAADSVRELAAWTPRDAVA